MARCLTRWFLPENVSKLRSCRTRDRKNRSGDMNRELLPAVFLTFEYVHQRLRVSSPR